MTGTTISHYRVLGPLGTGGMSVVLLAEDLRLGRQVAIKILPPALEHLPAALERLRREARLTSALNHPHICTIHDIGEHDGRTFLVMERLEGTTLKRVIEQQGALGLDRALRLGAQIADALAAAHAQGIVHRDVKPGNVFVTPRDDVKVTDFGLAKQLPLLPGSEDSTMAPGPTDALTLTGPGEAIGTIAYMAPEQARGLHVDARSDVFSLGAVVYEMLTGQRAFPGTAPAVVFDAILNQPVRPPQTWVPDLPASVVAILARTLAKAPADRYQDAAALRDDLLAARSALSSGTSMQAPASGSTPARLVDTVFGSPLPAMPVAATRPWRRRAMAVMALVVVSATVATVGWRLWRAPATMPLTERDSVMLGEFANQTGDPVFDGTLREALAVHLDQSPFLDILPAERVNETLRLMGRQPGGPLAHDVGREACERLNAKAMIEGAIRRLGEHFVVSLSATGCASGDTIVLEQTEVERREEVLRGVGAIARDLRARLGESLSMIESFGVPIEQATTPSLEALRAYTLGQARRAQGAEIESVPFFQRAVEIDPRFATAWNALSIVYGNLGETAQATEYGARAYAAREHVSERERLIITYQYHDRVTGEVSESIAALELWKRLYPRDWRPASSLAVVFNRVGNYDRAEEEAREAIRRSPDRGAAYSNLAYALRGLNRFEEARDIAMEAVKRGIETLPTRRLLFQLAVLHRDTSVALEHQTWAEGRPREFDLIGANAQVRAYQGHWTDARELYARTVAMARSAGLREVAGAYAAQAAWTAALFGNATEARALARPLIGSTPPVELVAIAALAAAGDVAGGLERVDAAVAGAPRDTLMANVTGPIAKAAIQLATGRAREALDTLRPAQAYDLGRTAGLASLYLRAEAYRRAGAHASAASEYARLIDHRGSDPFAIVHALATLGLARAQAAAGQDEDARASYARFLELMREADQELPAIREARAEAGRLPS